MKEGKLVVYRTIPTSNHNLWANSRLSGYVVYRTIPTSNHNKTIFIVLQAKVVYRTIPTSNHNWQFSNRNKKAVVYRTIPTSNHNSLSRIYALTSLYIVLFLHQTTTDKFSKAQIDSLYIVLFLHQTTTGETCHHLQYCCISYYSYIKPQQVFIFRVLIFVVYRTIPTSNHNLLAVLFVL